VTRGRNVLLITVDQWRGDCLGVAGHPCVRTPSLDRLAAEGTWFARHYAQAAPCGPSRASLHTGTYLMVHRSVLNGTPLDSRFTNVALEARAAGYDPVLFGYTDTSPDPRGLDPDDPRLRTYEGVLPGFRAVLDLPEHLRPWGDWLRGRGYEVGPDVREMLEAVDDRPGAPARYRAEDSEATFLTDAVLAHLDDRPPEPWFVHAAYIRPHPPFVAPAPYHALVDPADVPPPRRAAGPEAEGAVHPLLAGAIGAMGGLQPCDDERVRYLRAAYYGLMAEVDTQVGRLLDGLRDRSLWESTLVILTSDHGEQAGDHWLTDKLGWFDESYHVPLIVRVPGPEADATRGRRIDAFTENVDVMPTILDWIGADIPAQCSGRSLLPWVRGEEPGDWRREVRWEWDFRDPVAATPQRFFGIGLDECALAVIRDETGKYVQFATPELPPLFYDLVDDPHETTNRADDPACAGRVLEYAQRMLTWRLAHADRTLTGFMVTPMGLIDARRRP
jgi:arylsulfatase A-like enzyme